MNILKNAVNAVKRLGNLELESVKGVESRGAKVFQGSKNISKIKRKVAESAANSRRTLFIETPGCKGVNTASTGPESVHILHMKWTLQDTNKLLNETKGQKTKSSLFYPFSAGKDRSINKQRVLLLTFYKPFVLSAGWDKLHFTSNPDPFKLAHLLEGLAVFLWGHYGGQEQLHVADCLLHDHVKHTQQGAPLIQHLLGGRCGEIPGKHTHRGQTDADKQIQTGDANTHIDLHYTVQLKIKAIRYPTDKLRDHRGWDLQSAAFDQSLQNVVHCAANKQRDAVCELPFAILWDPPRLKGKTFNIQAAASQHIFSSSINLLALKKQTKN